MADNSVGDTSVDEGQSQLWEGGNDWAWNADPVELSESDADAAADLKAVGVIFVTAVLIAVHYISGWTF